MFHFSTLLHNPQHHILFSPFPIFPSTPIPRKFRSLQTLKFPRNLNLRSLSPSFYPNDDSEEHVIGDCIVFEEGIFEDPVFLTSSNTTELKPSSKKKKKKKKKLTVVESENLIPDKWREVQAEINITKKDRRKIAREMEFNSKVMKKKRGFVPLRDMNLDEYKAYKEEANLGTLKPPVALDEPPSFSFDEKEEVREEEELSDYDYDDDDSDDEYDGGGERVEPKNPRWAVYGKGLEDVAEFLNSEKYDPSSAKRTEDL